MSSDNHDKITLLLVGGLPDDVAIQAAVSKLGMNRRDAKKGVEKARKAIGFAATIDRDQETGSAILRCRDLYQRAIQNSDYKTALAAQKELNNIMGLYHRGDPIKLSDDEHLAAEASEAISQLQKVRSHLEPLGLAPDGYPIVEIARIAAEIIREKHADA